MRVASLALAFAVALGGCGTRDYKDRPSEQKDGQKSPEAQPTSRTDQNTKKLTDRGGVPTLFRAYAKEGLFWNWTADRPWVQNLKCSVRDGSEVDFWSVFGYQVFGGAIFGVIYKTSGGFWLGRPSGEPDAYRGVPVATPPNPAWAWERIYLDSARLKAGALRGIFWTGLCSNLLGPGYLLPTNGVFGTDFRSLSTSIALGIAAAVAAKPYANYFSRGGLGGGTSDLDQATSYTSHVVRLLSERFSFAGKKSFVGRTIAPNVMVVGIGGGVAFLVNRSLQQEDPNAPHKQDDPDCFTPTPTPSNGVSQ